MGSQDLLLPQSRIYEYNIVGYVMKIPCFETTKLLDIGL